MMMKRGKLYLSLLMLCFVAQLYAQRVLTIAVCDTQGNTLPYPEIIIGAELHRVGTKDGTLEVALDAIKLHDLLIVKYMGYKAAQIQLDGMILSKGLVNVRLEEETYLLDPVLVRPSNFSAEEYFQKRKKDRLLPYHRKYFFDLDFVGGDSNKKDHAYTGRVVGSSRRTVTDIDSTTLVISEAILYTTKLLSVLKRAAEVSYLTANAFCDKRDRKRFHCTYMGRIDDLELWEFTIRKQKEMPWHLHEDDEFRCIVALDKEGFISRIKTQLTSSSEGSASYLLDTQFGLRDDKLVPLTIKIDLVPNARNEVLTSLSLTINYSNCRKKR